MYKLDRVIYVERELNTKEVSTHLLSEFIGQIFDWWGTLMEVKRVVSKMDENLQSRRNGDKIILDTATRMVTIEGKPLVKIAFDDIKELKISYHQNIYDIPKQGEPSKIEFKFKDPNKEMVTVYFVTIYYTFNSMLEELYHHEINIKEYKGGQRAFKGKTLNFEEIQALKKDYPRIEW